MSVPVDRDLLQQIIDLQFGSVDGLAAAWEVLFDNDNTGKVIRNRDRSTIYKWLAEGFPAKSDILFGFCSLLDVDPVGIIQSDKDFIEKHFATERIGIQLHKKDTTPLAAFRSMYLLNPWWPNKKLAALHQRKAWHIENFLHEPGDINCEYVALQLKQNEASSSLIPRVYHFAYKQKLAIDQLWRPYGAIIAQEDKVRLIAESGDWQELPLMGATDEACVETFFGPRATRFRIVSLHPFSMKIEAPSENSDYVRFH